MIKINKSISNMEIDGGKVLLSVNPNIFAIDVIYSVAHSLTRDNYVLLDGDKEVEVILEIKPFDKEIDLEQLGREVNNKLLEHQVYYQKSKENSAVRQIFLQRALLTNSKNDKQ